MQTCSSLGALVNKVVAQRLRDYGVSPAEAQLKLGQRPRGRSPLAFQLKFLPSA
jgi:hypothetical protein